MYTYFTLYFTLYLFHGHIFICVVSHLQAYLERQSQLNMKKQKGRGKGRGRGRGGSRKKPIAEDDDDDEDEDDDGDDDDDEDDEDEEEQEEEEEKPMKSKKNKRHDPKEKKPEPKRRLKGKQENNRPGWTEEMWEEHAKWQWGCDWKQWEDETTWDFWDHQKSFDRYAVRLEAVWTAPAKRKAARNLPRIPRKRRQSSRTMRRITWPAGANTAKTRSLRAQQTRRKQQ